ncbi:hypothetical protein [Flavobacterium suncheonense]|uniref:YtkA-like domain-containing protein n=1 Tax=Flavobacterium suncheonense GH29-5 = DSM 17707 TaxID=1121899 RepID=A0A0A2MMW1_9FLAO|nr:hypothetical protein [Flavobacterium suncheonense]KGO89615.1 hypothetical protein Q764_07550 [Flavobacterium suncheonense GH29-5 = DSM 17707]
MKTLRILSLAILAFFASCSSDNDETVTANELDGLTKIQEMTNDTHVVELYSSTGTLQQGHNAISLRIKNKATNEYEKNATVSWSPLMYMMSMQHACPYSAVTKTSGKETLYNGYIVFQMAQNDTEYWKLKVNYTINGTEYNVDEIISVPASAKRRVTSFTGTDGSKYVLALIEPTNPKVALNDIKMGVFKMENMTSFPIVNDYTVKIDPRMPSMGNHGSPNNVNLTQSATDLLYHGKLSLTMTGYWKINLQLLNSANEVLKGEEITETTTESSIYFEVEF